MKPLVRPTVFDLLLGSWALACTQTAPAPQPAPRPATHGGPAAAPAQTRAVGAPANAPATAPPLPAPPIPEGAFGTPHPVIVAAASPERRWVVVCQARTDTNGDGQVSVRVGPQGELIGDRLSSYFIDAPGPGSVIDAFAGSDPTGRFVALVRGGRLILRDVLARADEDLSARGADARDDQSSFRHHRAVAFGPRGRKMLYLAKGDGRDRIVVRDLASKDEVLIDPGEGVLWRADFDGTSTWVTMDVVTEDTNNNGRLDWTVHQSRRQRTRCSGPVPRYSVWQYPGDRSTQRVAPAAGGRAQEVPHLLVTVGRSWLERHPDSTLLLRSPSGRRLLVADEKCEARVLHVDPIRQLVLSTCRKKNGRATVRLVGPGIDKDLGLEMSPFGGDHWFAPDTRLAPIHPGRDAALVDLEDRKVLQLRTNDRILGTHEKRALVLRKDRLLIYPKTVAEGPPVAPFARLFRQGSVYAMYPLVVDLGQGKKLGTIDAKPLALSREGHVLVALGGDADATKLSTGPLIWKAPDSGGSPP